MPGPAPLVLVVLTLRVLPWPSCVVMVELGAEAEHNTDGLQCLREREAPGQCDTSEGRILVVGSIAVQRPADEDSIIARIYEVGTRELDRRLLTSSNNQKGSNLYLKRRA